MPPPSFQKSAEKAAQISSKIFIEIDSLNLPIRAKVFSEVYSRAKSWQECRLVNGGLMKKYDCSMTKFVLANHHGWQKKNQISGDTANPLALIMERIAASAKDLLEGISD
jgi:hypothetical protein